MGYCLGFIWNCHSFEAVWALGHILLGGGWACVHAFPGLGTPLRGLWGGALWGKPSSEATGWLSQPGGKGTMQWLVPTWIPGMPFHSVTEPGRQERVSWSGSVVAGGAPDAESVLMLCQCSGTVSNKSCGLFTPTYGCPGCHCQLASLSQFAPGSASMAVFIAFSGNLLISTFGSDDLPRQISEGDE